MPSPFPGMDPYLEEPGLWPDVHHRLITGISNALAPLIRPKYYVRIEERLYVSDNVDTGRSVIIPGLRVVRRRRGRAESPRPTIEPEVQVVEPIELVTLLTNEIREWRVKVIDREYRRVVTVVEVLSPTNKVPNSEGRKSYLEKRQEVMLSKSNMVEIDLLRAGQPLFADTMVPRHDYIIHVSQARQRPRGHAWPILITQKLPAILIPLREEDPEVSLDLQAVLDTIYEQAGYDLELDYRADPVPPLRGETATWSDELLREKGLRKKRPRLRKDKS